MDDVKGVGKVWVVSRVDSSIYGSDLGIFSVIGKAFTHLPMYIPRVRVAFFYLAQRLTRTPDCWATRLSCGVHRAAWRSPIGWGNVAERRIQSTADER